MFDPGTSYGCWCNGGFHTTKYFATELYGKPVDKHDDACKARQLAYRCITKSSIARNEECKPSEVRYSINMVRNQQTGSLDISCSDDHEIEWCKYSVCMTQLRYLGRFWHLINNQIYPDNQKFSHNKDFDAISTCKFEPTTGNGQGRIRMETCCGSYPYRAAPIRSKNLSQNGGSMKCCEYNNLENTSSYGFISNTGAFYNFDNQKCGENGVEDI